MFVVAVSRLLVRPVLKLVARFGGREVFTAAALLVVIGSALTMEAMGLSMSLGAFLAGVLLADSEFRHELEADVEPFKGLLLGLFFMAVGMSANLALFLSHPFAVLGLALGLMLLKSLLMYGVARVSGSGNEEAQRIAVLIAQGGEFAFVLFVAAQTAGILPGDTADFLVLAVTISMLLAPLSFIVHERLLERWLERTKPPEFDLIDGPGNPVIIAGYGRYGQIVSRVLRMAGVSFTAIEASFQQVDFVRRFGSQGVLRRCVASGIARVGARTRCEAVRAGHRRRRGIGEDRSRRPQEFSRSCPSSRVRAIVFTTIACATSTSSREVIEREFFLSSLETARQALELTGMEPTAGGSRRRPVQGA